MQQTSNQSDLTASDVIDIREMAARTNESGEREMTDTEIAARFNVTRKTVYNIRNRNTWRNIPEPTRLQGFTGYRVYPDGRIYSESRQSFLKADTRGRTPTVRLTANNGTRSTLPLEAVITAAFGKNTLTS
jgi:hypothetical protein